MSDAMAFAALVFLVVVAVYLPALGGPFLWDDRQLVLSTPLLEKSASLHDYLRLPFWTGGEGYTANLAYYRPLVTWSFALDHRVHGHNPGGYHLTNLLLHATAAVLLFSLVGRAGTRAPVAGLLAVAWALLPRLAEAAAWISGRTDLMASLFVLAALRVWDASLARRLAAAGFFVLGLLAKESALALLPAVAVYEWTRAAGAPRRLGKTLGALAPLVASGAAYGALRFATVGFVSDGQSLGFGLRVLTVFESLGRYGFMLLDPFRPRALIGRVGVVTPWGSGFGMLLCALVPYLIWRFRARLVAWQWVGLALFAGALLPVAQVIAIPLRTLVADRFLYLPTAGLALVLAPVAERFLAAVRVRWLGAIAVATALAAVTSQRVALFSDEAEFWAETYLETPLVNNAAATELLGVYFRAGLHADALVLAERALHYDDPNKADPIFNAALCLSRLGRRDEALERLRSGVQARRSQAEIALRTAIIEIQSGRSERARAKLVPLAAAGHRGAGWLLARMPAFEAARAELDALGPSSDPERRARLAMVLGTDRAATEAWIEVLRSPTLSTATLRDALTYLVQTGERDAIVRAAQELARRSALPPELQAMAEVRVAELDRLIALRSRVGIRAAGAAKSPEPT